MNKFAYQSTLGVWLLTVLCSPAYAANIQVDSYEGKFYLNLNFHSSLLPDELIAQLTDYKNLQNINPGIQKSIVIGTAGKNKKVVWKKLKGCVAFICRELDHTEVVTELDNQIKMITLPEQSDFEMGESRWLVKPGATGSRVRYNSVLQPSFTLPPLIGNWIMKQKIVDELETTARLLKDSEPD